MRYRLAILLVILWPGSGFEVSPSADVASYYRDVIEPPKGLVRVYVLPASTTLLFGGSEHASDIYLGPDSSQAVLAGRVEKGQFLAFDVEEGRTLTLQAPPYGAATFHFVGNTTLFIRPMTRGMSPRDASGWEVAEAKPLIEGMDLADVRFDRLEPFTAAQHIQGWQLASLSPAAQAFVSQQIHAHSVKAAQPVKATAPTETGAPAPKAAQTDAHQSIGAIPSGTDANTAENDLVALKRFYESGLITREEYDAKRREVLHALH
jgi:hypothetical protein